MPNEDEAAFAIVVKRDDGLVKSPTVALGFASDREALALPDSIFARLAAESVVLAKRGDPARLHYSDVQMAYSLLGELGMMASDSIANRSFQLESRDRHSLLMYEPQRAVGAAVHLANVWIDLQGWLGLAGQKCHILMGEGTRKVEFMHLNSREPARAIAVLTRDLGAILNTTVGASSPAWATQLRRRLDIRSKRSMLPRSTWVWIWPTRSKCNSGCAGAGAWSMGVADEQGSLIGITQ
jgi:hypothetical protein